MNQLQDRRVQIWPLAAALIGLAAVIAAAYAERGEKQALAGLLGALCGIALYHASFGFTGGWRRLLREKRGAGFRSQMLLVGLIVTATYPLIAYGSAIGFQAHEWTNAISLASAIGAFVFGFGMQLGGGCGSGVLFTVGGGSTRMAITLLFFVLGSVLFVGTAGDFYAALNSAAQTVGLERSPRMAAFSFVDEWGAPLALLSAYAMLALLAAWSWRVEKRAHGEIEKTQAEGELLRGPWTKMQGAIALALASILIFVLLTRPWGITSAFTLWGGKALYALGAPMTEFGYSERRLETSLFADTTGVMDFSLMLGALIAAGLAGRFAPSWRLTWLELWTAVLGGLLMGYGARLAGGCNIGGFLGGVASASLHGWWWLAFGWLGSMLGVRMRSAVGMDPPQSRS